jgi:hypothetical protein
MTFYFVPPLVIAIVCALVSLWAWSRYRPLAILAIVAFGGAWFIAVFFLVEPLTKQLF